MGSSPERLMVVDGAYTRREYLTNRQEKVQALAGTKIDGDSLIVNVSKGWLIPACRCQCVSCSIFFATSPCPSGKYMQATMEEPTVNYPQMDLCHAAGDTFIVSTKSSQALRPQRDPNDSKTDQSARASTKRQHEDLP